MKRPGGMAWRGMLDQCEHGHPFTPENTYVREEGWRICRECNRKAARDYQQRRRAA